jgi:hypothetical protein
MNKYAKTLSRNRDPEPHNQKFPDWVDNEIYAYNNKHSLRSDTKSYGDKTH